MRRVLAILVFSFVSIHQLSAQQEFDDFVSQQTKISVYGMLANISPKGAAAGAVVASPSRTNPDYWYHWVRDAALVMDVIITLYENPPSEEARAFYFKKMNDFIGFSRQLQRTPNPSGGLGEPKFHVDGSAFTGGWGRPQNDGPALRALVLIRWASHLLKMDNEDFVRSYLYEADMPAHTLIKAGLEYVSHHWREADFDLWEEVKATHFFTRMVQRKALIAGAALADKLGDSEAAKWYRTQAKAIALELQKHWDKEKNILIPHVWSNTDFELSVEAEARIESKASGLDTSIILGLLHGDAGDNLFPLNSDLVVRTVVALEKSFREIYAINQIDLPGIGMGRYPEDTYDGYTTNGSGNPWFLTTLAQGQYYYRLANRLMKAGHLRVTPAFAELLETFDIFIAEGSYASQTEEFTEIISALVRKGDEFLKRVQIHRDQKTGALSEQFNRNKGTMQGAENLTWSYAAFLTATLERRQSLKLWATSISQE